jgi:ABC-type nitrate/sulfonate/bicarbonate transport system substrate-binding protein
MVSKPKSRRERKMKGRFNYKKVLLFVLSLLLLATGVLAAEGKIELAGTSSFFPVPHHQMLFFVARDEGLFDKYGVKINYQPMKSSADMYKAIAAGQFELGTTFIAQHLDAVGRGIPVKAIASHLPLHYYHFWTKTDSPINTMKDLDGKVVAVSGRGGIEEFYVKMAEQKFNIKVKMAAAGGGKAAFTLVTAGRASACVRSNATARPHIDKGLIRPIKGSAVVDMLPSPWSEGILWASDKAIKNKPEGLRRFSKAASDALKLMRGKDYYIKADMKYFKVTEKAATKRQELYDWTPELTISTITLNKAIDYFYEFGITDKKSTVEQIYDPSFLPR